MYPFEAGYPYLNDVVLALPLCVHFGVPLDVQLGVTVSVHWDRIIFFKIHLMTCKLWNIQSLWSWFDSMHCGFNSLQETTSLKTWSGYWNAIVEVNLFDLFVSTITVQSSIARVLFYSLFLSHIFSFRPLLNWLFSLQCPS